MIFLKSYKNQKNPQVKNGKKMVKKCYLIINETKIFFEKVDKKINKNKTPKNQIISFKSLNFQHIFLCYATKMCLFFLMQKIRCGQNNF